MDFAVNPLSALKPPPSSKSPAAPCSCATTCDCTANETAGAGELEWCSLHEPAAAFGTAGSSVISVYGRARNLPETTGGDDSQVVGEFGWGPKTVNPSVQSGFQYVAASKNPSCSGCGLNDVEFVAHMTPSEVGTFSYVYRFSIDEGKTWTYCDTDGAGSGAGRSFDVAKLGALTVGP